MAGMRQILSARSVSSKAARHSGALLLLLSTLFLGALPRSVQGQATNATTATVAAVAAPAAIVKAVAGGLSTCGKSTLTGFTSALQLAPGISLNWNANNNGQRVPIAVVATGAAATGWVSVAFSSSGLMTPADAVVGSGAPGASAAAVAAYHMASYSGVSGASINLGTKSHVATGKRTEMRFSRGVGDGGKVAVKVKGVNKLVWAWSKNGGKSVDYHGSNFGASQVDFSCNGATSRPSPSPTPRPSPSPVPVVPPSKRSKLCPWSTLPGFTYMVQLEPSLLLHWRQVSPKVIELAMEAMRGNGAHGGWMSLAWSSNGKMAPADAVIGNRMGGTVASYRISGYTMGSLTPTSFWLGGNPTVFTRKTGSRVMMFRRTPQANRIAVAPMGLNNLIWAHSPSNSKTLADHGGSYGRATIDFSCKVAPSAGKGGDDDDDDDGDHDGDHDD